MSLEQELAANTAALNRLAEVIKAAGVATCGGHEPKKHVPTQPAEKTEQTAKPAAAAGSPSELTYADIRGPFLKLVNADREKAVALLAGLKIKTLKDIEDKPELFASVLEKING